MNIVNNTINFLPNNVINHFNSKETSDRDLTRRVPPLLTGIAEAISNGISSIKGRVQDWRLLKRLGNDECSYAIAKTDPSKLTKESFVALVKEGLCTDSEEYLLIDDKIYAQRYELLLNLLNHSSLPKTEKAEAEKTILPNKRKEERLLLQYLSKTEKKELKKALNFPTDPKLLRDIKNGNWERLFKKHKSEDPNALSFAMLAAYCKEEIDIEDLATAMMFHRSFINAGKKKCHILPINEEVLKNIDNLSGEAKAQILKVSREVKPNQRFLIMVKADAFDDWTNRVIKYTFLTKGVGGFMGFLTGNDSQAFGTLSYGACKKLYPRLAPVVHLTPSLDTMFNHVKQGYSDFALFFTGEETVVHGSSDKTIFAQIHDLFHTNARLNREHIQNDLMHIAFISRAGFSSHWSYLEKLDDGIGKLYPEFRRDLKPTEDEVVAFLLDRIMGEIVDGAYPLTRNHSETLYQVGEKVLKHEFVKRTHLKGMDKEAISLKVMIELNICA